MIIPADSAYYFGKAAKKPSTYIKNPLFGPHGANLGTDVIN